MSGVGRRRGLSPIQACPLCPMGAARRQDLPARRVRAAARARAPRSVAGGGRSCEVRMPLRGVTAGTNLGRAGRMRGGAPRVVLTVVSVGLVARLRVWSRGRALTALVTGPA